MRGWIGAVMLLGGAAGCGSDQGFGKEQEAQPPAQTSSTSPTDATTSPDTPWDPGTDPEPEVDTGTGGDPNDVFEDPPDVPPPDPTRDLPECPSGLLATVDAGEIWIGSWDAAPVTTTIHAPLAGWFDLYNEHLVESGDRQWNESAYFRVTNATNPGGLPLHANCVDDWVITDLDNAGPPPGAQVYIGTFWLDAGPNTLELHHYCGRYRAGECAALHIADDPNSTCDTSNINSVHFYGTGICLSAP